MRSTLKVTRRQQEAPGQVPQASGLPPVAALGEPRAWLPPMPDFPFPCLQPSGDRAITSSRASYLSKDLTNNRLDK